MTGKPKTGVKCPSVVPNSQNQRHEKTLRIGSERRTQRKLSKSPGYHG